MAQRRGGSRLGCPNKATAASREAIARLIDGNIPRVQRWLDEVYERDGPRAALGCLTDLIEYHVPKLARVEQTGLDGGPQVHTFRWLDAPPAAEAD